MADGSLRIEVEVEPNDAQAAFAMFGRPGAPMALAALVVGHAQAGKEPDAPKPEPAEKPDHTLSKWAAIRCAEDVFQEWASRKPNYPRHGPTKDGAAEWIRLVCEVKSRAELDTDPAAAARFHERVRGPYLRHCLAATP